jgi:hypothetical protein
MCSSKPEDKLESVIYRAVAARDTLLDFLPPKLKIVQISRIMLDKGSVAVAELFAPEYATEYLMEQHV